MAVLCGVFELNYKYMLSRLERFVAHGNGTSVRCVVLCFMLVVCGEDSKSYSYCIKPHIAT